MGHRVDFEFGIWNFEIKNPKSAIQNAVLCLLPPASCISPCPLTSDLCHLSSIV